MSSFVIRHSRPQESWDNMSYDALLKLIKQESDGGVDQSYLATHLDRDKIMGLKIKTVYHSPSLRAKQTAKAIAKILGCQLVEELKLQEIKFDSLPEEIYQNGREEIRHYLLKASGSKFGRFKISDFSENEMFVTHGFLMRHIFSELFNTGIETLDDSDMFTQYLSGFDLNGKYFTLSK